MKFRARGRGYNLFLTANEAVLALRKDEGEVAKGGKKPSRPSFTTVRMKLAGGNAAPRIEGTRTRGALPAAIVALTGLVIMLEPWRTSDVGAFTGALLGLASAVCYAANTFVVKRVAARIGPARAMSYHSLAAAVLMLPLAVSGFATGWVAETARRRPIRSGLGWQSRCASRKH